MCFGRSRTPFGSGSEPPVPTDLFAFWRWTAFSPLLQGIECAIIIIGLIALTPGLIQSFSTRAHQPFLTRRAALPAVVCSALFQ